MLPFAGSYPEPRAWTPEEIMKSIRDSVASLQRQGTKFSESMDHAATGTTYIIAPETSLGWVASACFDHFEPKLSRFFEVRVHWTRVMSYARATGERCQRVTFFDPKFGRDAERGYCITDLKTPHGEHLQLGEGNYTLRGWDLSTLSDDQRREVCAEMNDRKYPDSYHARQRRAEKEVAAS